jgi:hypothetical protein
MSLRKNKPGKKSTESKNKPTSMARYETQGHSKIINSYGAIGTVIQTVHNGSLMIMPFNSWPYYLALKSKVEESSLTLEGPEFAKDTRLLRRVQNFVNCASVQGLFKLPENEGVFGNQRVENEVKVISARFFPEWFYNPYNGELKHLSGWQNMLGRDGYPTIPNTRNRLEQFPFVIVSESGKIFDIPWREFILTEGNIIDFRTNDLSQNLHLSFSTAGSAERLETKTVRGGINGQYRSKNLGSLPNKTFIDQQGNRYSMAIIQGNNISFVKTLSSIFIPIYQIPSHEIQAIKMAKETLIDAGIIDPTSLQLFSALKRRFPESKTTLEHISDFQEDENFLENEEKYREYEHQYLISHNQMDEEDLNYTKLDFGKFGIKNLYKINKLKVTHVQEGFSRLTPSGTLNPIFSQGHIPVLYPAVEMKGEGIMFEFDVDLINNLINTGQLSVSAVSNSLHSFSHCIMKEFEFEAGYSINSLKERLYFGEHEIHGVKHVKYASVLIYTATGSNSSFGGLCALFDLLGDRSKLEILIENAIERAKDCPNDPICIEEERSGNKGCCYACNLIPEVACEKFNTELNREQMNAFFELF